MNVKNYGLSLSLFALIAAPAFADDALNAKKEELKKGIEERITALQKDKECVEGAQDHAALKGCRQESVKERKAFRDKHRPKKFRQGSSNDN